MYKELARFYDLIYQWKDYEKESNRIKELIEKYKKSPGKQLLDVGCGTGKHIEYFRDKYSCVGVDLNEEILIVARENIKKATFKQADMVTMNLNSKFDVITCLFSAIGYVKTYLNLEKTIQNFVSHLEKDGIIIIEPWFTKLVYRVGHPGMTTYESEEIKIARLNSTKLEGDISVMEMHYLIVEKNKDVKYFVDTHELGLFEIDKSLEIMKNAGLEAEYLEDGLMKERGLYIGVKL